MNRADKDAEFIAHAREDIPALLAAVDSLRAELTLAYANQDTLAAVVDSGGDIPALLAAIQVRDERVKALEAALERAGDGLDLAADWMKAEANRQSSEWAMKRVGSSEIGMRSGAEVLHERAVEARVPLNCALAALTASVEETT
jgi:hypothetical protein